MVVAVVAILIGLFPSILSLGALLAVPTLAIALVGVFSPKIIEQRRWLRRFSIVGGVLLGSELVLVATQLATTRRRPVRLVVDHAGPSEVRIVYGVTDADSDDWSWERSIVVPRSGLAFVKNADNGGWYSPENPQPLTVMLRAPDGRMSQILGSWVSGGYTEGAGCHFEYDEYLVGHPPNKAKFMKGPVSGGWLDSLETWGVECRGGKLYRASKNPPPHIRRSELACYKLEDGTVACSVSATRNRTVAP